MRRHALALALALLPSLALAQQINDVQQKPGSSAIWGAIQNQTGTAEVSQYNTSGSVVDSFRWLQGANPTSATFLYSVSPTGSVFGAATGGRQGAGTINAQGLYVNGVAAVSSAGGSSGQVQYNNGGVFGGISNVTTNGTNIALGTPLSGILTNATGLPLSGLVTGTIDTAIGYWGSTTASAIAVPNCSTAVTYSTGTHTWGCNASTYVTTTGSPSNGQNAIFSGANTITGVPRAQPTICDILTTAAVTCNNGGSSANNGTYTTPSGALYLKITMIGGGGGGGGSGSAAAGDGTSGANTCWNTSGAACTTPVYQATGGTRGTWSAAPGGAGGGTAGSSTCTISITGQNGAGQRANRTSGIGITGPRGGNSALLGGGGDGAGEGVTGNNGVTNTGGGGQGGGVGITSSMFTGSGGGGGGTCIVYISSPAATYTYAVAAGVSGGSSGTSGFGGGNGASGRITVEAYFN